MGRYRFATLPAVCWVEFWTLGLAEERDGAREEVTCSMVGGEEGRARSRVYAT